MEKEGSRIRSLEANRETLSHIVSQRRALLPRIGTGEVKSQFSPESAIKVGAVRKSVARSISRIEDRIASVDTEIKEAKLHQIGELVEQGFLTAADLETAKNQLFPETLKPTISLDVGPVVEREETGEKPSILPVTSGKGQELLKLLLGRNNLTGDEIVRLLSLKNRQALNQLVYSLKPKLLGTGFELMTPGKGHSRNTYFLSKGTTQPDEPRPRTVKRQNEDQGPRPSLEAEPIPLRRSELDKKFVVMGDVVKDGTRMVRLTFPEHLVLWETIRGSWENGLKLVLKDQHADLDKIVEALNKKLAVVTGRPHGIKVEQRDNGLFYSVNGLKIDRREGFLPPKPERIRALGLLFGDYRGGLSVGTEDILKLMGIPDRQTAFEHIKKSIDIIAKRCEAGIATDDEFRINRLMGQFMRNHNLQDYTQLSHFLGLRFFRPNQQKQAV